MRKRPLLFALAAIVLWGTLAAVVGDALEGLPAAALVFWSFVFAAPTLLAWDLLRGRGLSAFRADPKIVALGLWGIWGYHALFFEALARAPIVQANLLNYLWPLLMVVLAPFLAREKASAIALAGAAVGFAGAALVVTQGRAIAIDPGDALGYLFAFGAALSWSSFSVLLRRFGKAGEDRMALFGALALAASFLVAAARHELAPPPARALAAAAWVGFGPMAIAFICWDRAMAEGSASRIGTLSYLDPLLSTLCVSFALDKPLTAASLLGMALIVGGAAVPALRRRRKA